MNDINPIAERHQSSNGTTIQNDEETLVADSRGSLTPSQMVEQKLIGMRKSSSLLISQIQQQLKPGSR